jgi:hypothetical protein
MLIEVEVTKKIPVHISELRIEIPFDEEDDLTGVPEFYIQGNKIVFDVDPEDGEIIGTQKLNAKLDIKVRDEGKYTIFISGNSALANGVVIEDYVPSFIPGDYGDYVRLDIEDSMIANWLSPHEFEKEVRPYITDYLNKIERDQNRLAKRNTNKH